MNNNMLSLDELESISGGATKIKLSVCPYCQAGVRPADLITHKGRCKMNPKNQKSRTKSLFYSGD